MALKLLHTADWHLGMRFPSFSEDEQQTLTRARMDVVDRIFGVAERNQVHAVLCAGDLFDKPNPEELWWKGLLERLQNHDWTDRPVFLLPGNHDPYISTSIYCDPRFLRGLPSNVHVIDRVDFSFELAEGAVLFAVPCLSAAGQMGMLEHIPTREPHDRRIRIGMVHGQTFAMPGYQTPFPLPLDGAAQRGLDYLAVGDTHAFRILPDRDTRHPMVYPGAPEPTNFGETEAGYVALVCCPRGRRRVQVRQEKIGTWRWDDVEVTSVAQLETLARERELKRVVLRLRLHMDVTPPERERVDQLLRQLQGTPASHGLAGVVQIDRSRLRIDTRDFDTVFAELPDVLMAAARRLRAQADEAAESETKAVAEQALYNLYQLVKQVS